MKWDAVVVGAGVAGLTAALRLADSGRRVLVVAKGVGATHLAPGTVDVLGYADARVDDPMRALPEFAAAHPQHPYALLRREQIAAALEWFRARIAPYRYVGDLTHNFLLPTAAGSAKPSALVPETMAAGDLRGNGRVAVVGLRGLKDFFPAYAAANLARSAPVVTRAATSAASATRRTSSRPSSAPGSSSSSDVGSCRGSASVCRRCSAAAIPEPSGVSCRSSSTHRCSRSRPCRPLCRGCACSSSCARRFGAPAAAW
jgi:glycerol-3-phosphate dehydrogenase subunit B